MAVDDCIGRRLPPKNVSPQTVTRAAGVPLWVHPRGRESYLSTRFRTMPTCISGGTDKRSTLSGINPTACMQFPYNRIHAPHLPRPQLHRSAAARSSRRDGRRLRSRLRQPRQPARRRPPRPPSAGRRPRRNRPPAGRRSLRPTPLHQRRHRSQQPRPLRPDRCRSAIRPAASSSPHRTPQHHRRRRCTRSTRLANRPTRRRQQRRRETRSPR